MTVLKKDCLTNQAKNLSENEVFQEISIFQSGLSESEVSGDCSCFSCDMDMGSGD